MSADEFAGKIAGLKAGSGFGHAGPDDRGPLGEPLQKPSFDERTGQYCWWCLRVPDDSRRLTADELRAAVRRARGRRGAE